MGSPLSSKKKFSIFCGLLFLFTSIFSSALFSQCPVVQLIDLRTAPGFVETDSITVCGTPDTLAFLLYIPAPGSATEIDLTVDFMPGMEYGGFVFTEYPGTSISPADVSDPEKPEFSIGDLAPAQIFVGYLAIGANCKLITNPNELYIDFIVDYTWTDLAGNTQTCSSSIRPPMEYGSAFDVPVINILDVDPEIVTLTELNVPVCQEITISQD